MKKLFTLALLACAFATQVQAQTVELTEDQYNTMKAAGTLPREYHVAYSTLPDAQVKELPIIYMSDEEVSEAKANGTLPQNVQIRIKGQPEHPAAIDPVVQQNRPKGGGGGTGGVCNCWVEPDASYTTATWVVGSPILDDQSTAPINLPFQFNLYGQMYSQVYVNINGNLSFGNSNIVYSSSGFPAGNVAMVAPFWADVDLGGTTPGGNVVKYKVTPNAMYVNWVNVGYFNDMVDKLNTFQLIISDGTSTDVGIGQNVSFCYKQMQWTTGSASGGTNGFGGTPATVGANRGNNLDYIQFGKFDNAGSTYLGPQVGTSQNSPPYSGVGWLDNKNFVFTTAVSSQNVPPIASSTSLCDTVDVCVHELVDLDINFLSPEPGQLTTVSYSILPPLNGTITETNTSPANTANLHLQFIPQVGDTTNGGFHTITYTATDDGVPPMTSTVSVVIHVFYTAAPPPLITGDTVACAGQGVTLTATGGYQNYDWSNGFNGPVVLVGAGTYYVEASTGACILVSNMVTVTEAPSPAPVINGVLFNCGGEPATLSTTLPYAGYTWSTGSTDPSISVGSGTYSVSVTNDEGCNGTSAPVTVVSADSPIALFQGNPNGPVYPGTTVVYTDQSNPNGATITGWAWSTDSTGSSNNNTFSPTFNYPGSYLITLTVTTSDGCTSTYTYSQLVIPVEIIVPNVFSPNNDGKNDALVFEGVQYYPNTSLSVFNRWGQEIYTSRNYKNTWKAADVPEGTYFYILKLSTGKEYTGNVTLLR